MRFATELETAGGRIAHTIRIVQVFCTPCCTVTGSSDRELAPCHSRPPSGRRFRVNLDLALRLPHWRTAPAHITALATKLVAWMAAVSPESRTFLLVLVILVGTFPSQSPRSRCWHYFLSDWGHENQTEPKLNWPAALKTRSRWPKLPAVADSSATVTVTVTSDPSLLRLRRCGI